MKARKMLAMAGVAVAAALAAVVGVPGAASANHCPEGTTYPADCVHSVTVTVPSETAGSQAVRTDPGTGSDSEDSDGLPVTGGDVVGLTVMGLGAVGLGALLVRRSRRTA